MLFIANVRSSAIAGLESYLLGAGQLRKLRNMLSGEACCDTEDAPRPKAMSSAQVFR